MNRLCDECGELYDDFNHMTYCPHPYFEPSSDAKQWLTESGIDWQTGRKL